MTIAASIRQGSLKFMPLLIAFKTIQPSTIKVPMEAMTIGFDINPIFACCNLEILW